MEKGFHHQKGGSAGEHSGFRHQVGGSPGGFLGGVGVLEDPTEPPMEAVIWYQSQGNERKGKQGKNRSIDRAPTTWVRQASMEQQQKRRSGHEQELMSVCKKGRMMQEHHGGTPAEHADERYCRYKRWIPHLTQLLEQRNVDAQAVLTCLNFKHKSPEWRWRKGSTIEGVDPLVSTVGSAIKWVVPLVAELNRWPGAGVLEDPRELSMEAVGEGALNSPPSEI
eukprot:Gb_03503 [translate_table: standard]